MIGDHLPPRGIRGWATQRIHRGVFLILLSASACGSITSSAYSSAPSAPSPALKKPDSCIACHRELGGESEAAVIALENDIHKQRGFSCADCHGGDPSQDDPELAMDPRRGYVGRPKAAAIPRFCGKCHSDANLIKKYNPQQRVDQEAEYLTSVHGKLLKKGDEKVATCISCHGNHGIRAVSDAGAPVYPTSVAKTCSRCHASAEYMKPYGLPHDQFDKYKSSVHADALFKRNDLSAPTCNDCHGNHGAAPPGVTSVANVCGTCHTRQAELFRKSPHQAAFATKQMAECLACHENHAVRHPTDERLGVDAGAVCSTCHSQGDRGYQAARVMRQGLDQLVSEINQAEIPVQRAAQAGMEVSRAEFDLGEARDSLVNARVVIHQSSPSELKTVLAPGLEATQKARKVGQQALSERQVRRKGLAASLIFIFLAVVAIYLKIRQIERH